MSAYIAYIDHALALQLATGLIGSEVALSKSSQTTAGLNFKVIFSAAAGTQQSTTTRLEHLLPEVLIDAVRQVVPNQVDTLDDIRSRLQPGNADHLSPGSPLLLRRAQLRRLSDDATDIEPVLAGELCDVALLTSGDFQIRAYMNQSHAGALARSFDKPIEALGVLRYAPPYTDGGASAVNLGLRIVAVWLK